MQIRYSNYVEWIKWIFYLKNEFTQIINWTQNVKFIVKNLKILVIFLILQIANFTFI